MSLLTSPARCVTDQERGKRRLVGGFLFAFVTALVFFCAAGHFARQDIEHKGVILQTDFYSAAFGQFAKQQFFRQRFLMNS